MAERSDITGEDRDDILHARQLRIFKALGISWDDVGDNLVVRSVSDKAMWLFNERGPTAEGHALVDEITKLGGQTSVGVHRQCLAQLRRRGNQAAPGRRFHALSEPLRGRDRRQHRPRRTHLAL